MVGCCSGVSNRGELTSRVRHAGGAGAVLQDPCVKGAKLAMLLMLLCVCVCVQMFDWISHNKEVFLQSHTEIGRSYQHAVELQTQHNHFAMNSMVANVSHSQLL